jgi:small subunit ribosomal protein S3
MGQKVSPVGLRVGIIRDWDSRWYADKNNVKDLLVEDIKIRNFLNEKYKNAAVSKIVIERLKGTKKDRVKITLHTAKPGVVIGREAETKNQVVSTLAYMTKKDVVLNVVQVENPECDAVLVAKSMAEQLENRASFRRVQKVAIQRALKNGAKGAKTLVSGRLGGAEMARSEGYAEGQVPLHTLRANVDYATAEADTTYGKLGVKVWIYKGEVLPTKNGFQAEELKKERKNKKFTNKKADGEKTEARKPRAKKAFDKEKTNEGGK